MWRPIKPSPHPVTRSAYGDLPARPGLKALLKSRQNGGFSHVENTTKAQFLLSHFYSEKNSVAVAIKRSH